MSFLDLGSVVETVTVVKKKSMGKVAEELIESEVEGNGVVLFERFGGCFKRVLSLIHLIHH